MNVNQIRDRIIELCRGGDGPDADLQSRALNWLNSAYHEVMDDLIPYLPQALQRQEEAATTSEGTATLDLTVYRLLQVADRTNGQLLQLSSASEVLNLDPADTATGAPQRAYADGAQVKIHPAAEVDLAVRYVPLPAELVADGGEETILLPKPWHHVLVWGGLVWAALFERGFGGNGEVVLYQQQWQNGKANIKLALRGNLGETLRVQPVSDM